MDIQISKNHVSFYGLLASSFTANHFIKVIIGKLLRIHYFSPFLDLATELVEKDKMRRDHQICIVGQ